MECPATAPPHGPPLMEPLIWNATSGKPFGRSRLKRSIRTLIDDYIRIVANATIALEFRYDTAEVYSGRYG